MKKKPEDMYSNKSFTNLTVFRSGKKVDDREIVITCGYTNDGRYGYFICEEQQTTDKKSDKPMWVYTNQRTFVQKKNEQAYREILQQLKQLVE